MGPSGSTRPAEVRETDADGTGADGTGAGPGRAVGRSGGDDGPGAPGAAAPDPVDGTDDRSPGPTRPAGRRPARHRGPQRARRDRPHWRGGGPARRGRGRRRERPARERPPAAGREPVGTADRAAAGCPDAASSAPRATTVRGSGGTTGGTPSSRCTRVLSSGVRARPPTTRMPCRLRRVEPGVLHRAGEQVDQALAGFAQEVLELAARAPRRPGGPGQRDLGLLGVGEPLPGVADVVDEHLPVPPLGQLGARHHRAQPVGPGRGIGQGRDEVGEQELVGVVAAEPGRRPRGEHGPRLDDRRGGATGPDVEHRDRPGGRARGHPVRVGRGGDRLGHQLERAGQAGPGPVQDAGAGVVPQDAGWVRTSRSGRAPRRAGPARSTAAASTAPRASTTPTTRVPSSSVPSSTWRRGAPSNRAGSAAARRRASAPVTSPPPSDGANTAASSSASSVTSVARPEVDGTGDPGVAEVDREARAHAPTSSSGRGSSGRASGRGSGTGPDRGLRVVPRELDERAGLPAGDEEPRPGGRGPGRAVPTSGPSSRLPCTDEAGGRQLAQPGEDGLEQRAAPPRRCAGRPRGAARRPWPARSRSTSGGERVAGRAVATRS